MSDDSRATQTNRTESEAAIRESAVDRGQSARDLDDLRTVADYQFGADAGEVLFPPGEQVEIRRSTGGRPRQLYADDERLVSYRTDGRFTLAIGGGRRLHAGLDAPANRVVVGDESEPFVREGSNTFAKFVDDVDPEIRPGDEVLVVHEAGELLAVGRAELSANGMVAFSSGMAVKGREGVDE